ncbi:PREDICTED: histone deacetylase complex subunit SAP25 isoform X2 [Hipposideros armiger]|uniref:Histone deacetylase complex subunit SAP25 isoform X2 n=1 Tax=Hipposideros armiger TaxID=186990 RepID=A0A8B7QAI4_HIPAR|nr:PREDICTED: histone deacetylase complex subunit SAP25 isoform X2 [Hipposideros armiger]
MLPWPSRRWGAGEEQAPEEHGRSAGTDPSQAWNSGEEALGEPGTSPQDRPQPRSPRPFQIRREQLLAGSPSGLAAEQSPGTPVPLSPQMAWEVAPSRMTLLAPWDPNYEAKAGPQLEWGPSCGSGASFSGRTLCHPSWPLYEAASGRGCRPLAPTTGHQNGEQAPRGADPLLPWGQRVPLYLSEAPQQMMGSLKLLLPPPIMSPWVRPVQSPRCSTAWLSGPELIALSGLLQMSQGEPRPSSSGPPRAPPPPASPPDPVSDQPGPSGCPSCSHCTDPSLPWTPGTH